MSTHAIYTLERWTHGWLLCGESKKTTMNALTEVMPLFANTYLDLGIVNHLRVTGRPDVFYCIATSAESKAWRAEIMAQLQPCSPEERWWLGFDVGKSSAAIFGTLSKYPNLRNEAHYYSEGKTPKGADDFGRCMRLLALFPGWSERLPEVASKYPETAWPAIIARWTELQGTNPVRQGQILRECEQACAEKK